MAAHRYWRASNLTPYGGPTVELSEFWLLSGSTRVDGPATLTSDVAPVSGILANLRDNNTSTAATLQKGTSLTWDFGGSPADVTDIRVGSSVRDQRFLNKTVLQWSDDGSTWTSQTTYFGVAWPGVRQLTISEKTCRWLQATNTVDSRINAERDLITVSGFAGYAPAVPLRSSGTLQFEVVAVAGIVPNVVKIGVGTETTSATAGTGVGKWLWGTNGATPGFYNQSSAGTTYGSVISDGAVVGVVVNFAAGSLTFYLNGVSQGTAPATGLAGQTLRPMASAGNAGEWQFRIRGSDFAYPVAGADPWAAGATIRQIPVATPQSTTVPPVTPPPARYDRVATPGPMRVLANFFFDPNARGRIIGTVKRKGTPDNVPLARRVRLYRDVDGLLVAETWSNANGDFVFENIEENFAYTTLAYDYERNYRAVAADNLTLANGAVELMR